VKPQNMTSSDSVIEQRKAFQPFVDVFKAAQAFAMASDTTRYAKGEELKKVCDQAREDLAQLALDAYLATLPKKPEEASSDDAT